MLNISRGKIAKAQKVVIYGPEGIGKTTFAAKFPDPLFIDTEGSTLGYDVARIDPTPQSWNELLGIVREVKQEKPCKTLVLDTADWAEMLCIDHLCTKNKWASIETPGYGAGYTAIKEEFGKLLNLLSDVIDAGINVVVTAHAIARKFDRPDEVSSYDRWELKLQRKTAPLVKEWADTVIFANYKITVENVSTGMNQKKGKARGGKRVMYAEHNACWDAKNRWGLSGELEFSYDVIAGFIVVSDTPTSTKIEQVQAPQTAQQAPSAETPTPVAAPIAQATAIQTPAPISPPLQPSADPAINTKEPITHAAEVAARDNDIKANLPDYWQPLYPLMEREKITFDDIRLLVCDVKGWFSRDTPFENYPEDMVKGALIAGFDKCVELIRQQQALTEPIPFS